MPNAIIYDFMLRNKSRSNSDEEIGLIRYLFFFFFRGINGCPSYTIGDHLLPNTAKGYCTTAKSVAVLLTAEKSLRQGWNWDSFRLALTGGFEVKWSGADWCLRRCLWVQYR